MAAGRARQFFEVPIIEILRQGDHLPPDWSHWNDPEVPDEMVKGAKRLLDLLRQRRESESQQSM